MKALCVDDERLLLDNLVHSVSLSPDVDAVYEFTDETEALEWVRLNPVDIAFLDIRLHVMTGLELGELIREIIPNVNIIFCTGYEEYSLDAFKIHADGYLLKPINPRKVQDEIDFIKGKRLTRHLMYVKTSDGFEAFDKYHNPIHFKRTLTKELLEILVERDGISINSNALCDQIWHDGQSADKNREYLKKLFQDLKSSLREVGADDVLQKTITGYIIDTSKIQRV